MTTTCRMTTAHSKSMETNIIYNIDCLTGLRNLPDDSIDCCVTSPPYFNLRDYGVTGQIGLEESPEQYIQKLVGVFHEVKRVLAPAGTLWINIGDCYAGSGKGAANYPDNAVKYKQGTNRGTVGCSTIVKKFDGYKSKDLIGIPWMLAFAEVSPVYDLPRICEIFPWYKPIIDSWATLAELYEKQDYKGVYHLLSSKRDEVMCLQGFEKKGDGIWIKQ